MRMNEKNVRLQTENKSLKQDLQKMMEDKATNKDKQSELVLQTSTPVWPGLILATGHVATG